MTQAIYASPRPIGLLDQLKHLFGKHPRPGITIKTGADGLRTMFVVTSNGYKDREEEYITTKALSDYVERAWIADDVCDTDNTLRFWHSEGAIGDIIWTDMEADTFLIEAAKERPDALVNLAMDGEAERPGSIKAAWDYIEANPAGIKWGASHGFKYGEKRLAADGSATYDHIEKFETSVLPLSAAANPYTYSGVIDMTDRNDVLDKIVGQTGAADKLRKGVQEAKVVLDKAGVEHKSLDEEKVKALLDTLGAKADTFIGGLMDNPPAGLKEAVVKLILSAIGEAPAEEETPTEETPATPGAAQEQMGKSLPGQTKLLDTLIRTQEGQAADIQELVKAIKALAPLNDLATAFKAQTAEIQALKGEVNTVKAQLSGRPRAASQAAETVVDDAKMTDEAKKQLARKDPFWGVEVVPPAPAQ